MKRSVATFIGLLVILGGVFLKINSNENSYILQKDKTENNVEPNFLLKPSEKTMQIQKEETVKNQNEVASISTTEINNLRRSVATQVQVKKEIKSNPHYAPRGIIHFAQTLGLLMEKGLKKESDAKILISELRSCALNESADVSIRALCVSNAEKLTVPFSHLKGESDQIRESVPVKLVEMADARKILNNDETR